MHVYTALVPMQDYISKESAWSSNDSTYQRKYLAISKVSIYNTEVFISQKGYVEALNFLTITPWTTSLITS